MDIPISKLIERIKEVNYILAHCADTDLSFDEAYRLHNSIMITLIPILL